MKVVTVLGARPQFIKAGSVSREIARQRDLGTDLTEVIVHTGQHFDNNMSDVFFQEMRIPAPDYHLGIGGKSHGAMTGRMLERIEEVLVEQQPDWTLVYGDTNSTLAGALAACKLGIPVAHVEAGLRSFNMAMPEEINRILTDRVSRLLLCPTQTAMHNLEREGIADWKTDADWLLCGDVMLDGALFYSQFATPPEGVPEHETFVLCTVHRAENTDNPGRIAGVIDALNAITHECKVIFPVHPRTKNILLKSGLDVSRLTLLDPVGYLNMLWLLKHCTHVFTDSGGLQKEAFYFQKPCFTLRNETEWVELVDHGFNVLVGTEAENILHSWRGHKFSSQWDALWYGAGKASQVVVHALQGINVKG
ncbi:MAG TPA: UDP-N-acetylglucosamine 2-epimerase (non-hydrolyzing) [Pirellulaceae bacterium]|nr:UDP-N-acetylglucosamine 2-epimerase (non-hydrolyzing) [Pirellulaceae bacterium]HMO94003.1 UDP-N-acetylglucosamine 2-epimerase (non-hydrolyzing) [Pirellulaceae bacterium]HMP70875.1 UDP-N-acetylglucosamine 2-epimerase (non-hydrolyzing) [Pirellulaceae bacterium]